MAGAFKSARSWEAGLFSTKVSFPSSHHSSLFTSKCVSIAFPQRKYSQEKHLHNKWVVSESEEMCCVSIAALSSHYGSGHSSDSNDLSVQGSASLPLF